MSTKARLREQALSPRPLGGEGAGVRGILRKSALPSAMKAVQRARQ